MKGHIVYITALRLDEIRVSSSTAQLSYKNRPITIPIKVENKRIGSTCRFRAEFPATASPVSLFVGDVAVVVGGSLVVLVLPPAGVVLVFPPLSGEVAVGVSGF